MVNTNTKNLALKKRISSYILKYLEIYSFSFKILIKGNIRYILFIFVICFFGYYLSNYLFNTTKHYSLIIFQNFPLSASLKNKIVIFNKIISIIFFIPFILTSTILPLKSLLVTGNFNLIYCIKKLPLTVVNTFNAIFFASNKIFLRFCPYLFYIFVFNLCYPTLKNSEIISGTVVKYILYIFTIYKCLPFMYSPILSILLEINGKQSTFLCKTFFIQNRKKILKNLIIISITYACTCILVNILFNSIFEVTDLFQFIAYLLIWVYINDCTVFVFSCINTHRV